MTTTTRWSRRISHANWISSTTYPIDDLFQSKAKRIADVKFPILIYLFYTFFFQFWTLLLEKRQCKYQQKALEYHRKPSTDLPHLSTLPTHARWRDKSVFLGGMWTFSSPIWFSWCDWISENRVAVSRVAGQQWNLFIFSLLTRINQRTITKNSNCFRLWDSDFIQILTSTHIWRMINDTKQETKQKHKSNV